MHCFHALPLAEQILIAVCINTGDKTLAVKAAGYRGYPDDETFVRNKMSRRDFSAAYRAVSARPALIHDPSELDLQALKKMAVRAFDAELGNEDQGRVELIRLLWNILKSEKPSDQQNI